jgi:two-component system chemotaxis response regulator CheB
MVRVLIVEDSPFIATTLKRILESDGDLQVVGIARNGKIGLEMTKMLLPDVITMDIRMPVMDGFEATKRIMTERPTPILVVSSSVNDEDLKICFNAIQAGALDVLEKPAGVTVGDYKVVAADLIKRVKLISEIRVFKHLFFSQAMKRPETRSSVAPGPAPAGRKPRCNVFAIGASTGGPTAVFQILSELPGRIDAYYFLTQHIAEGFGRGLAEWLTDQTKHQVRIPEAGEPVKPGVIYLAPDRGQLSVRSGVIQIARDLRYEKRPIDYMIDGVAREYGSRTVGVLLTGMGNDGVEGLKTVKEKGGRVVVQDEATSVVFGMPKAAVDAGVADEVLPLGEIPGRLMTLAQAAVR